MGKKTKAENISKKKAMMLRTFELFTKFNQICLVTLEHVGSNQVQQIRRILTQKKSHLIITKNTLLKKVLMMKSEPLDANKTPYYQEFKKFGEPKPELKVLIPELKEKVALLFTDASVYQLKTEIEKIMVAQQAKVGTVSPIDLVIPPGPTGMDPSQIGFFHALQISTKIQKAQIEINKEFKVCTKGRKVTTSEAVLLKKLNLKPFFFGMKFMKCYDSGSILEEDVLGISPDDILASFQKGSSNLTAMSVQLGVPTSASVDIMMATAIRNLEALSLQSGVKVAGLQIGSSPAPQKEAATKKELKEEKKKEEKKPEPEPKQDEEEEEYGFGDLF